MCGRNPRALHNRLTLKQDLSSGKPVRKNENFNCKRTEH